MLINQWVGLIPAAGQATRLHGLPKFLLPTAEGHLLGRIEKQMRGAGVGMRVVIGSEETMPLIDQYAEKSSLRAMVACRNMNEALLKCQNFTSGKCVIMAMPDTYIADPAVMAAVMDLIEQGADVALGVFYARPEQRHKRGMVEWERRTGRVLDVVDKPQATELDEAWGVMAWSPVFWEYLGADMPHCGYGIIPALEDGLDVAAVHIPGGYWDCGTFDEYADLCRYLAPAEAEGRV